MNNRQPLSTMGSHRSVGWNPAPGDSWRPVNLADCAEEHDDGTLIEPPSLELLVRADGKGLLYPGRTHDLHGPPESGKSWVALLPVRDVLLLGGRALFMDYEDCGPEEIIDRLRRLGVPTEVILSGLTYVQPRDPPSGRQWEELVYEQHFRVAVIDAAVGALAEMQRDGNSNADVAVWAKAAVLPLAQGETSVIVVDHTPLTSNRVIGATAKKGSLTGASYRVVATKPLIPGGVGIVDLHVVKDRAGAVRAESGPVRKDGSQHAARIAFDATDPLHISADVGVPGDDVAASAARSAFTADQAAELRERLSRIVETAASPPSQNTLAKAVAGDRHVALTELRQLIADGYVTAVPGKRNAIHHHSARPFRAGQE